MLKFGDKKRHKTGVLESGREDQLGKWIPVVERCKSPLEICGHKIKVGPS